VRENFFEYMVDQFSPLERKSIEPIALAVSSRSVRALQRTVNELSWDEDKMLMTYHQLFAEDMGFWTPAFICRRNGLPANTDKGEQNVKFPSN
jgi:hypothetical protein